MVNRQRQRNKFRFSSKMSRGAAGSVLVEGACGMAVFMFVGVSILAFFVNLAVQLTMQSRVAVIADQVCQTCDENRVWLNMPRPGYDEQAASNHATKLAQAMCQRMGLPGASANIHFENKAGYDVYLNGPATFENHQFTSSFKERGALNRLHALSSEERARGVIAMSAGNHAQGVAYHARRMGIPATIVMPVGTPMVKVENTRRHDAEVIISGQTLEEAGAFAREHAKAQGLTLIHPYDDPLIMAGTGTIAPQPISSNSRAVPMEPKCRISCSVR